MNEHTIENGKVEVKLSLVGKDMLDAKLHKLNVRAAKLGVPPVSVEQMTPWTQEKVSEGLLRDFAMFRISVHVPKLAGWRFLATLQHLGEGVNLINKSPAAPEDLDLSAYRTAPPVCEHCNTLRKRSDTYVIEHETGTRKQVGSNCLCDVLGLGTTPEQAVQWAEWVELLSGLSSGGDSDADYDNYGSGRRVTHMPLASFLNVVAALVRVDGYRSRKYAEASDWKVQPTCDDAMFHLDPPLGLSSRNRQAYVERYGSFPVQPTDEDVALVQAAIAWAAGIDPRSDFDHNLRAIAGQEMMDFRNKGIAAYLIAGYRRHVEKDAERKAKLAAMPESKHVGEIGKRIKKAKVTYLATPFSGENDYGAFFIHKFQTEDGSDLVWKTGTSMENETPGRAFLADFTPKAHTDYKGRPQTEVSRMKLS